MKTFGERAFQFYKSLDLRSRLPQGVTVMNPYKLPAAREYMRSFLVKFFSDNRKRIFVFGINPGRFGAGITGITFTDPVALEKFCGIKNSLNKRREPSSIFIYEFINQLSGPKKFYKDFFLTAVSPLGFTKNGKNYNFYDNPNLLRNLKPFLVRSIQSQLKFGADRKAAIVLGTGKVGRIFSDINGKYKFFETIYAVEHPRFIVQYRRRKLGHYLKKYHNVFTKALRKNDK